MSDHKDINRVPQYRAVVQCLTFVILDRHCGGSWRGSWSGPHWPSAGWRAAHHRELRVGVAGRGRRLHGKGGHTMRGWIHGHVLNMLCICICVYECMCGKYCVKTHTYIHTHTIHDCTNWYTLQIHTCTCTYIRTLSTTIAQTHSHT